MDGSAQCPGLHRARFALVPSPPAHPAEARSPAAGTAAGRFASDFPVYTRAAMVADRVVHCVGVPAGVACAVWLVWAVAGHGVGRQVMAAVLYGAGLVGMLGASAGYNTLRPGRAKAAWRRLDHAMIFVMIAGSYTPFALCALPPEQGWPLFAAAWGVAAVGVALKLRFGTRYNGAFIALYLLHGWMILPVLPSVVAVLPSAALWLLLAGGAAYSAGVAVHVRESWQFSNPAWHVLVLLAAGLHLGAISQVLGIGGGAP